MLGETGMEIDLANGRIGVAYFFLDRYEICTLGNYQFKNRWTILG